MEDRIIYEDLCNLASSARGRVRGEISKQ